MQMPKRIVSLFIVVILLFAFTGCESKDKVFSKDGMSITLTDEFEEKEYYDLNAYYDTEEAQVYVIKESFELLEENDQNIDVSLEEYAEAMMNSAEIEAEVKFDNGLTYFVFEDEFMDFNGNMVPYIYYAVVFKSADAFWLFQFACEDVLYDKYEDIFVKWAKSVRFD